MQPGTFGFSPDYLVEDKLDPGGLVAKFCTDEAGAPAKALCWYRVSTEASSDYANRGSLPAQGGSSSHTDP